MRVSLYAHGWMCVYFRYVYVSICAYVYMYMCLYVGRLCVYVPLYLFACLSMHIFMVW